MSHKVAKDKIADDISDTKLYSIMMDGSTDKTGHELVGIIARYMNKYTSNVSEHVADMKDATDDKSA